MSSESMNYVRKLAGEAYLHGASNVFAQLEDADIIRKGSARAFIAITVPLAASYARKLVINEKALHRANGEEPKHEEGTTNLQKSPTTPRKSVQLPPLAADLEGLAVSLGVLAGKVPAEEWEFLKIFRANLRAAAERVTALENSLEVPHEQV